MVEKRKIFSLDKTSFKINLATGIALFGFMASTIFFFFDGRAAKQDSAKQIKDLTDKNIILTQNYIDLSKQLSAVQGNTQTLTNTIAAVLSYSPQLEDYRIGRIEKKIGMSDVSTKPIKTSH